jgi:hypothetical protein
MTYIIFRLLHNLFDLCQVSLFKTAKHWDSFFTHCKSIISIECSILDLPFSSLYQGTTTDGKTFEGFLGSNCFEKRFMLTFDNFLHEFFDKWMNSWSANI